MKLFLVDIQPLLVKAWRVEFNPFSDVEIICCDILEVAENTIVSPANGHGIMDGGIDLAYSDFFGPYMQDNVFEAISHCPEGYLPVGSAKLVDTGHSRIPNL